MMRSTSLSSHSLPSRSLLVHTRSQSGVALITVLMFLILIMIVGAIAVRQASVDLNVAASDQVGTLLLNNSDSVLAHVEESTRIPSGDYYERIMSIQFGILGHFSVQSQDKVDEQVSVCYQPTADELFNIERSYIRKVGPSNKKISKDQSCDADNKTDYTSDRHTAMTQIIVKGLEDDSSDNFDGAARATSEGGVSENSTPKVQVNSVSILPAMSSKSVDDIKDCLGRPVGNVTLYGFDGKEPNINECLKNKNIPSTFVVEEGLLQDYEDMAYNSDGEKTNNACEGDKNCQAAMSAPSTTP